MGNPFGMPGAPSAIAGNEPPAEDPNKKAKATTPATSPADKAAGRTDKPVEETPNGPDPWPNQTPKDFSKFSPEPPIQPNLVGKPPLPPTLIDGQTRTTCPNCGSTAVGMAGGLRRCNQCQHAWQ